MAEIVHWVDRATLAEAERDKLREALEWVAGEMLEQGGVLAPDWFDAMRERGLLVPMPADRTYKADYGEDTMYVLAWQAKGDKP